MEKILLPFGLFKETVTAIVMLCKIMKVMVCSPGSDTDFLTLLLQSCKEIHGHHFY